MDLHEYLRILRKRWVSIVTITVLGTALAGVATLVITPRYEATAHTFVSVRGATDTNDLLQGSSFSQNQVKSYAQLVTTPLVLQPVIDELGLSMTTDDLALQVSAESPADTVLINITASSTSAEQAAAIANTAAATFSSVVPALEQTTDEEAPPVKITTVQKASVPLSPAVPKPTLYLGVGFALGLVVGLVVAVLRESLDTVIRDVDDVELVTGAPVLGAVPYDAATAEHPLAAIGTGRGESLRRLRTNLQFTSPDRRSRSIVVTSAVPGEGKSTTTINLGLALAEANARVIVVDADLRRSSIADYLGLEGAAGLTTVLIGQAKVEDVVQRYAGTQMDVLAAGQIPPNPSEMLDWKAMADLLTGLVATYDIVLIDTPPLLPVTDAAVLSRLCGGTLVVAGSGTVRRPQLADALNELHTVGANLLGIVLNSIPRKAANGYAHSYYGNYRPHSAQSIAGHPPMQVGGDTPSTRPTWASGDPVDGDAMPDAEQDALDGPHLNGYTPENTPPATGPDEDSGRRAAWTVGGP